MNNDYTVQLDGKLYQIQRDGICPGLRGAIVRIERRLDGSLAVRFRDRYLPVKACVERPTTEPIPKPISRPAAKPRPSTALREAMSNLLRHPGLPVWIAAEINKTLTTDTLED